MRRFVEGLEVGGWYEDVVQKTHSEPWLMGRLSWPRKERLQKEGLNASEGLGMVKRERKSPRG